MEKRIIFKGSVEADISIDMNNYQSGTYNPTITSSSNIYISSRSPFNSIYVKFATASVASANISVEYWDGNEWRASVDVLDETAGFTQSGHITWYPNRDYSWSREHTNYNGETITGLTNFNIYSQYWVRLVFDNGLDEGTTLSWFGDLFCDDQDIYAEFPDFELSSTLTSFKAAKTDWEEQRVIASRELVKDMVDKKIITHGGQILNRRDYREACVQKTAEIIFRSFGDDFIDQKNSAYSEYMRRLTKRIHRVDLDGDALEDDSESRNETGFLNR